MQNFRQKVTCFLRSESGATVVEYAALVAIIVAALVAVIYIFGDMLAELFDTAGEQISTE